LPQQGIGAGKNKLGDGPLGVVRDLELRNVSQGESRGQLYSLGGGKAVTDPFENDFHHKDDQIKREEEQGNSGEIGSVSFVVAN